MKTSVLSVLSVLSIAAAVAGQNNYTVQFEKNIPYGVFAWSQSERVRKGIGQESRFGDYNNAGSLADDANVNRDVNKEAEARKTSFWQAYDEKGWYIYIEAEEPLIDDLLDNVIDPKSTARKELYEIYFTPGLERVPYYQILTTPFAGSPHFVDWGMPSKNYRSLKDFAKVESLPLKGGFGTFVFIPWEALYEFLPLDGAEWRFTIIRWMPFGKAGGVTWGGQVHETGRFGIVRFAKPTAEQKAALERRMLRYGWFKFQADSKELAKHWNDPKIGDPEFYEKQVRPAAERIFSAAPSPREISGGMAMLKNLMEFPYTVSSLREQYLLDKQFDF